LLSRIVVSKTSIREKKTGKIKFVPDQKWIDAGLRQAGGISTSITLPDWTVASPQLIFD